MDKELKILSNKAIFIKAILDNKLKINNSKKEDIIKGINKLK